MAIVGILLTGCSAIAKPAHGSDHKQTSVTQVNSPNVVELVINDYLPSAHLTEELVEASQNAINECLSTNHYAPTWKIAANQSAIAAFVNFGIHDQVVRSTLWGFFDPSNAARYGYLVPPGENPGLQTSADTNVPANIFAKCVRDAQSGFANGDVPAYFAILSSSLPDGGPKLPASNSSYVRAVAAWSRCMKVKGFYYTSPLQAIDDPKWEYATKVSVASIASATADVSCKLKTNLVGIGVAAENAEAREYIATHQSALKQFDARITAYVRAHKATMGS